MDLNTPKNNFWRPAKGYESVEPYKPPSNSLTIQTQTFTYVPDGMTTAPVKFPSLLTGFENNPNHVARAVHAKRYPCEHSYEYQKNLSEEVCKALCLSEEYRPVIECWVDKEREKRRALSMVKDTRNILITDSNAKKLNAEIEELSKLLQSLIYTNENMQDCKRKLKSFVKFIEAPIQITQECLNYREARYKNDCVNDIAEQSLIKEHEVFQNCKKSLKLKLEKCKNQLFQGRKIQAELENFILTLKWTVLIERLEEKIKSLAESCSQQKVTECLKKNTKEVINNSLHLLKQIEVNLKGNGKDILEAWNKTNESFKQRRTDMIENDDENKKRLFKVKNEIHSIDKNLKYLKSNEKLDELVKEGEELLRTLNLTRVRLESDITTKLNSLFIDEYKCMSMRRCFPISLATEP